MKLVTKTGVYVSPKPLQGNFENVFIEDSKIISIREKNRLEVTFDLYFVRDGQKNVLDTFTLSFWGNEVDDFSSNRTTWFIYPNPDYDETVEGSEMYLKEPYFAYLAANAGVLPTGAEIVDYGYPTLEKALMYFTGGTLSAPEVFLDEQLAKDWLLNTLTLNGELIGRQFQFPAPTV